MMTVQQCMKLLCMSSRSEPYVWESDEEVRGEPRPLSVLLLVTCGASSAAAVIDMIRSSSGVEYKYSQSDRQKNQAASTLIHF